jgi:hypothetical protein
MHFTSVSYQEMLQVCSPKYVSSVKKKDVILFQGETTYCSKEQSMQNNKSSKSWLQMVPTSYTS